MYHKEYVGKGKKDENFDIVKVTLSIAQLNYLIKCAEAIENKNICFNVAKMKEADKFGNTHTCYFNQEHGTIFNMR